MISIEEAGKICTEHYELVYKFCYKMLRKKEDAEDIAHDTFVLFLEKRPIIEDKYIKTWLLTVANNKCLNEFSRRKKYFQKHADYEKEIEYLAKKADTLQSSIVYVYAERFINEAYENLNEKEKRLFDLLANGDKKEGEIADEMEISKHACYMRKTRLMREFADKIRDVLFY